MKFLHSIFKTDTDYSTLLTRLLLGAVFFPHGAQKVLGWFGGYGFSGTMGFFTGTMGIPAIFAFLAIAAEFAGAIALVLGFFTRISALGIASIMAVAIAMVHGQHGFFMNWYGNQKGEGYEYHLLALTLAVVLMMRGGGKWSVDGAIAKALEKSADGQPEIAIQPVPAYATARSNR
ncbi:MAG: DoxX family protein [Candidatus Methylacidiphilales bacterium]|nr:DoxX family protein [Candidatus Methylacidiphilales bacterium]